MTDQRPKNRVYNAVLWRDAVAVLNEHPKISNSDLGIRINCDIAVARNLKKDWNWLKKINGKRKQVA